MPKYDFKCKKCSELFEVMMSIKELEEDSPKKRCPKCDSVEVKQQLSFASVGSGGSSSGCPSASSCGSSGFG